MQEKEPPGKRDGEVPEVLRQILGAAPAEHLVVDDQLPDKENAGCCHQCAQHHIDRVTGNRCRRLIPGDPLLRCDALLLGLGVKELRFPLLYLAQVCRERIEPAEQRTEDAEHVSSPCCAWRMGGPCLPPTMPSLLKP